MKRYGVCIEALRPYDKQKFSNLPLSSCYACLKTVYPFSIGLIYSSFWKLDNTTNGLVPLPTEDEIQLENPSLHAVLVVAYDDDSQRITILNSWGSSFGMEGYFFMHYDYILNKQRAYDIWKTEEVGESNVPVREIGGYFDIKFCM